MNLLCCSMRRQRIEVTVSVLDFEMYSEAAVSTTDLVVRLRIIILRGDGQ